MSILKEKLKNKDLCIGAWIQIPHMVSVEIMSNLNFDWICIDAEHASVDIETISQLLQIIEKSGSSSVVRLPLNNEIWIKRCLDAGANGLICPMVNSRKQAEDFVFSAKYPPLGKRSFGFCRANLYGEKFAEYVMNANSEISLIAQIEHKDAIKELEQISDIVDATFIGPYDLSGSMGLPGEFDLDCVQEELNKYVKISKNINSTYGLHIVDPNKKNVAKAIGDGYTLIALGMDTVFLNSAASNVLSFVGDD